MAKSVLLEAMKSCRGLEVQFQAFLTAAVDGIQWIFLFNFLVNFV